MRILVVDDHPLVRDGIVSLLRARHEDVVGEAGDGAGALALARKLHPDVILMDIRMPSMGGLEATRRIKAELPEVKIVMLTVSDDDADLYEAIKSGADGYLLKSLTSEEFFALLAGVSCGEAAIPPSLAMKMLRDLVRPEADQPPVEDALTAREEEVLRLLARGLSNREIGAALGISENTVKYHTRNLLDKLHLRNRSQVIAYAARQEPNDPT
jgi:DNA-binding NarL/FixJ family response regulator